MFGFSVTKILFTAAVIIAVWYGFKWIGRMQRVRDARSAAQKEKRADAAAAQDMTPCPKCGVYTAAGAAHTCGGAGGPEGGPKGGDDNAARPG